MDDSDCGAGYSEVDEVDMMEVDVPERGAESEGDEDTGSDGDDLEDSKLVRVTREIRANDYSLRYWVRFENGKEAELSFERLASLDNGKKALNDFLSGKHDDDEDEDEPEGEAQLDYDHSTTGGTEAEEDWLSRPPPERAQRQRNLLKLRGTRRLATLKETTKEKAIVEQDDGGRATRSKGLKEGPSMLSFKRGPQSDDDDNIIDLPRKKSQRRSARKSNGKAKEVSDESEYHRSEDEQARRSGRTRRHQNYAEPVPEDEYEYTEEPQPKAPPKPKLTRSKEIFPIFPDDDEFVQVHNLHCETCQKSGPSDKQGHLIFCQGCSASYHKACIGLRNAREHLVTKVSSTNFVLQCKRCIGRPKLKDHLQASWDRCTDCGAQGDSCEPFKPLSEAKIKAQDGRALSPDIDVPDKGLYAPGNVLFRCQGCSRAWHYDHLPERDSTNYAAFTCLDCVRAPGKIDKITAWRPIDPAAWDERALSLADFTEDEREYLVKFDGQSYFHVKWVPGPWLTGAFPYRRLGFLKNNPYAILSQEKAIDESWLRVEIILRLEYTSYVPVGKDVNVDLARVREVAKALIKYKGLGYDEVVWDSPPLESDGDRWADWKSAYYDYVHGLYVRPAHNLVKKIEKARRSPFDTLELAGQPRYIKGGTLMDYQKEGMNWLYYKWWAGQNVILADEMGLGKTIQIISFLSVLFEEHKIWPFLVVAPQSTVPNWKREIRTWAPSLRVVAYYGTEVGRKHARQYEMFGQDGKLKCHIVVTSYTTPVSDATMLRKIPWQALIVDEGQCLKNEKAQLHVELMKYTNTHKVLLSGTPLQNNPRELFNMLQFLNPKDMNAQGLEDEFGIPTVENVPKLHTLIRPYFLRRTKAQVLTDLPPMAEVIVPISMTALQKSLYKSILEKDAKMIRSLLSRDGKLGKSEKGGVRNLLMQLRKCVCHPFVYSRAIEEINEDDSNELIHRNLVEAGSKLGLLNIMLPKLKERGHRVLIFSQFLGMLDVMEDFLVALGLKWYRLDGNVSSLNKQKAIDEFNAPDSDYFAFLLSTRAGGVGINLATADTVIILDPDHNPHSDMQALSRAHRIGQKHKVLVFHLMTRDTVEEKIMQVGKKKKSLDHLIIERMGDDESGELDAFDVESILAFGAKRLFEDDNDDRAIKYDNESVDKLLDRSQIEETKAAEDNAGGTFSFARVWANEKGTLEETDFAMESGNDDTVEVAFWDRIVKEREEIANKEAAAKQEELGRGRRRKTVAKYAIEDGNADDDDNDTDFHTDDKAQESDDSQSGHEDVDKHDLMIAGVGNGRRKPSSMTPVAHMASMVPPNHTMPTHMPPNATVPYPYPPPHMASMAPPNHTMPTHMPPNATVPYPYPPPLMALNRSMYQNALPLSGTMQTMFPLAPPVPENHPSQFQRATIIPPTDNPKFPCCRACHHHHAPGTCSFKQSGVELCPFCKTAHFTKRCPHMASETQLNLMLESLRESTEAKELVDLAKKVVRGRKGAIRKEKARTAQLGTSASGANT
ncbi:P-loop containing nucleoside triphosphate hydrolase protein [Tricharina praecox]|uniref:P-loop containing nucleoside triphosphate hydrolase protein n=1 Tax=Tricharina praecox TaxID=43433 RepID=UPI00222114FE|nr:P-loop containing nucleoside triphosphate hydrolase protein [Tricharina praecox]KAI5851862.1 P-loop containing nucleoside triphosphate hydrolase protein [Tricharina praecox]